MRKTEFKSIKNNQTKGNLKLLLKVNSLLKKIVENSLLNR